MSANGPTRPNRTGTATANDVVMTPPWLAQRIVHAYPITGTVLEPACGDGAFHQALNTLPHVTRVDCCEITRGDDFLTHDGSYDWIVTNPPYSIYDAFLQKSFDTADHVLLLVPLSKCMKSVRTERLVDTYGGLRSIRLLGPGSNLGFPFGFLTGLLHYQRHYQGPIERTWGFPEAHP